MLVVAELDLATATLGLPTGSVFTRTHQRPLAFLTQAREDLRGCVSTPLQTHQPHAGSAALVLAAVPQGSTTPHTAAFLADGYRESFASALQETEALAAEAGDGQENSKSTQQGEGVLGHQRLHGAHCTLFLVINHPFSPLPQETTGCLEASAILHISQVLHDLRCAALQERCT